MHLNSRFVRACIAHAQAPCTPGANAMIMRPSVPAGALRGQARGSGT